MGENLKASIFKHTNFPDLMTADEVSAECFVSAERLLQYARSGYAPCLIVDDTTVLFFKKDIMEWVKSALCKIQMPEEIRESVRVISQREASYMDIPESILPIHKKLKSFDLVDDVPVIYFLIKEESVVYIGQSGNLLSRVGAHRGNKDFDKVLYFNHPAELLNSTEAALIRFLKPKYNIAQANYEADDNHYYSLRELGFKKIEVAL